MRRLFRRAPSAPITSSRCRELETGGLQRSSNGGARYHCGVETVCGPLSPMASFAPIRVAKVPNTWGRSRHDRKVLTSGDALPLRWALRNHPENAGNASPTSPSVGDVEARQVCSMSPTHGDVRDRLGVRSAPCAAGAAGGAKVSRAAHAEDPRLPRGARGADRPGRLPRPRPRPHHDQHRACGRPHTAPPQDRRRAGRRARGRRPQRDRLVRRRTGAPPRPRASRSSSWRRCSPGGSTSRCTAACSGARRAATSTARPARSS